MFRPRQRGGNSRFNRFSRNSRFTRSDPTETLKNQIDHAVYVSKNKTVTETKPIEIKNSYNDFNLHEHLKKNILSKGYVTPTPIQDQAIPVVLEGKDIIGMASTGTGKTAAFLIPLINKVYNNRMNKVIIITPTRELANQIDVELKSLSRDLNIQSVVCIGGQNINLQMRWLYRNHHFLICTPGRLKDLIQRDAVRLNSFNNVVLDEADRMFDMGFIKEIKLILNNLPKEKQTLFFSATLSKSIEELIRDHLVNPVKISVNTNAMAINVKQETLKVTSDNEKIEILHDLLIKEDFSKVLIFGKTKWAVEKLKNELKIRGFRVESIHGNKTQSARQISLSNFKTNRVNILVATDVAARGLDIDNVSHVINYELPENMDDYIHRIGRTGRGDKLGTALTFV